MGKVPILSVLAVCFVLSGCGEEKSVSLTELNKRDVRMPDGAVISCETMTRKAEMMRGMMFRDSLPADQGMMFIHATATKVPYFLYQVKIPLDIIWLDKDHNVVEISADTPPCPPDKQASQCPQYGGNRVSQYVIEIGAGLAAKHNVAVGKRLDW